MLGTAPSTVEQVAVRCSAIHSAFRLLLDAEDLSPPEPIEILVVDDSIRHRLEGHDAAPADLGVSWTLDRRGPLLILSIDPPALLEAAAGRIATHLFEGFLPTAGTWLSTALPEVLARAELRRTGLALQEADGDPQLELLYFLMAPGSDRQAQFSRYLKLLRAATPDALAFDIAFAGDLDSVRAESLRGAPSQPPSSLRSPPAQMSSELPGLRRSAWRTRSPECRHSTP